ncbi:MAG: pilin [Vibrio sp.]
MPVNQFTPLNLSTQKQRGFSLIELMMVLAVIGLLVSVAIPKYQNYLTKAALNTTLAQASSEKINVEVYINENGQFPDALAAPVPFNQGEINYQAKEQGAGDIIASITSGAAQGSQLYLSRENTGQWSCVVHASSDFATALPKSCQLDALQ